MPIITSNISSYNNTPIGISGSIAFANTQQSNSDTVFFVSGSDSARSVFGGTLLVSGSLVVSGSMFFGDNTSQDVLNVRAGSVFTGNVGIGTTFGGDLITISGSTSLTGSFLPGIDNTHNMGSAAKRWNSIFASNISGSLTGSNVLAGQVVFAGTGGVLTGVNNLFWDNTNSNLGVGTSTITARLFVTGSSTASTATMVVREGVVSPTGGVGVFNVQNSAGTSILFVSGSGGVGVGTTSTLSRLIVSGSSVANAPTLTVRHGLSSPTAATLDVQTNSGVSTFWVSGSGNSYFSGSVGLGVTQPGGPLQVMGTSGSLFLVTDSITGSLFSVNDIAGLPILEVTSDDKLVAGAFGTNALVVSSSTVAIGTATTSTVKLLVSGSSFSSDQTAVIKAGVSSPTTSILDVQSNTGTSRFFVSGSGDVGIGTTSFTGRLFVSGSSTGTTTTLLVKHGIVAGSNLPVLDVQDGAGTSILFVSGSGAVGIGTNSSITARLHVSGSSSVSTPAMIVRAGTAVQTGGTKVFQVLKNNGTGIFHVSGSGDVNIDNGNLVIGTSGKGIDFSSTSNAASGSLGQEIFDDYEEGTWTPSVGIGTAGVAGSITLASSTGNYTKVGRLVHCQYYLSASSVSSPNGTLYIQGLPFQSSAAGYGSFGNSDFVEIYLGTGFTAYAHTVGTIQANTNYIQIYWYNNTGGLSSQSANKVAASTVIDGYITFTTDQ